MVTIALLKTRLHNGDTVLNGRTPNLVVVIVVIVVDIVFARGIVEGLTSEDLPVGRFGGRCRIEMTDIMSRGVSMDTLKVFGPEAVLGDED